MIKKSIFQFGIICVAFFIVLTIYQIGFVNRLIIPSPIDIIREFFELFFNRNFYSSAIITLYRVLLATIISLFFGITIGILLGHSKRTNEIIEPFLDFFRSIPISALFPVFMLFFGVGNLTKIALCVFATTLIIILNTSYGTKHSNKANINLANVYNRNWKFKIIHIVFPQSLPHIFAGIRTGVSISLVLIIFYEMFVGATDGLGYLIMDSKLQYNISEMYALILFLGLVGYGINKLILFYEKRAVNWTGK